MIFYHIKTCVSVRNRQGTVPPILENYKFLYYEYPALTRL